MYNLLIFLHVAASFGFVMAHGVSAGAAFALRRERRLERLQVLLELSASSYGAMYLSLLTLLASGVAAGFLGQWWRHGWIWAALGLLVAIGAAMGALGSRFYGEARKAAGLPYYERGQPRPPEPALDSEAVTAALARANPVVLLIIGYGGLLVIIWLMMFKPF